MDRRETIRARGHANVRATHRSTLEVTTDTHLTPAGDCIVGVEADRAPAAFSPGFVGACRDDSARIEATLRVDGAATSIVGRGDSGLTFGSDRAAVIRTSDYVDDRTVLVRADAAAADLNRELVSSLAGGAELILELHVR